MWQTEMGRGRVRGITLIETMIVIALLGFLAALAVPEFRQVRSNARLGGNATQLAEFFGLARATAILERTNIRVVQVVGGWEMRRGNVVFKRFVYSQADQIVESLTTQPAGLAGAVFRFTNMGFLQHENGAVVTPVQLDIGLCIGDVDGEQGRTVEIRRTGPARSFQSIVACPVSP